MKLIHFRPHVVMIYMLVILQSCSTPPATEVLPTASPVTEAAATEVPPTPVIRPATEISIPPTEVLQHVSIPIELPEKRASQAEDFDCSRISAIKPIIGGDRFTFGELERPFNANTMDKYIPDLDIVNAFVFQDDIWIYGKIQLMGRETDPSLTRRYALELDLDRDGRGEWFVIVSNPLSTTWTVEGVQVYQDVDGDIGNSSAMRTDASATSGNGFEVLVFNQGVGDDPDTAWARTSPADPNVVEISIKRSVLGNPKSYMVGMWAGSSLLDPVLFDLNDHFTYEQAGAADPSYYYYPIKEVAEIDNTCRMAVGFQTGKEIGLCKSLVPVASNDDTGDSGNGTSGNGGNDGNGGESCPPCPAGYNQVPYPYCTCILP